MLVSFGIAAGATILFLGFLLLFSPPQGTPSSEYSMMQYLAMVWKGHLEVNGLNTLFFFWAIVILVMKFMKLRHQKAAMLLDILPYKLGNEINAENVGSFIDHLYKLPSNLRDSMMVNRIRKSLEIFEIKQNSGDVVHLMSAQSDIDAGRIAQSFAGVKAFLWAIPILGFIGTVLGLSHALLSLSFDNLEDVKAIIGVLKGVISGLGTAFDATLVGLVFAMLVNFPMNAMIKMEDDNLNNIDSFCNEVLVPRLNDGAGVAGGDTEAVMNHLVRAVASAQSDFLVDLNALSATMMEYAANLEQRSAEHQQHVSAEFSTTMQQMRDEFTAAATDSVKTTSDHTRALAEGITALNSTLKDLGEKQIVINQTVKKGWFSRG
jgi:flagellar motor component MotA